MRGLSAKICGIENVPMTPAPAKLETAGLNAKDFRLYKREQAGIARRMLYPVTAFYTCFSVIMFAIAWRTAHPFVAIAFYLAGVPVWTFVEYFAHIYVLHGQYKPGKGLHRRLLVEYVNPVHWEHHERPFDGEPINGELSDLLPLFALAAPLSFIFPAYTAPMLLAGVVQSYVIEEWVHQSVHFYNFRSAYFKYIRKHHTYHHTSSGMKMGYGFTSGIWDVVFKTRFPAHVRQRLYGREKHSVRAEL
jgi:sterol desaturase/sphingolipid hydroxylase (fatty acid hydroxylase superfamily)